MTALLVVVGLAGAVWFAKAANDVIMSLLLGIGGGVKLRRGGVGLDGGGMLMESDETSPEEMSGRAAVGVNGEEQKEKQLEVGLEIDWEEKRGGKAAGCAMCVYVFPPLVSPNKPGGTSTQLTRLELDDATR